MSIEFILRLIGMIAIAALGGWGGAAISNPLGGSRLVYTVILGLLGALIGLILTPYITIIPLRKLQSTVQKMPIQRIMAILLGLVVGLLVGALAALPLSLLPDPFGQFLPFIVAALFGYLGVAIISLRQTELMSYVRTRGFGSARNVEEDHSNNGRSVLLDTSVIIDGRVADIAQTGFIGGSLIVPNFVLNELQHIADSSETLRRNRGRRGLELLNRLQKESLVPVKIVDLDVEGTQNVDDKLVILAKQMHYPILTNDYNLNKVAELQGVVVLNVNELANAVRAIYLPGESLNIRIIQEGKERGQGVGYLDDGTMVVVEDGERYIEQKINTVVTKVLQTAAGRMIFARPTED
ncbi:MAG: PIN domain nuclease [Anaerolineales bacterium]|nr:PIN domain nuclease [Anaerolineales bacterium]